MSGDQQATRQDYFPTFADLNPRPPTPKQTPTSAVFPSSFTDAGGWTPCFAEDYSVFNSTPGNLRGSQGPFRLLSAEGLAAEVAIHVNHFSPNPSLPLPPVDPSRRLASSPNSVTVPSEYTADSDSLPSPGPSKQPQSSSKKPRRGAATDPEGERKLAPKFKMQNDQSFGQPDFTGSQQHDIAALMAASGDMFGYPMSAPVGAPATFWDPSNMGMDLDFSAAPSNVFQSTPAHSHRHTGSFDWNSEIQLFQDPSAPSAPMQPINQGNMQPLPQDRILAPKPSISHPSTSAASVAMSAAFAASMDDPFGTMTPGDVVDPGMLFSRPQTSAMESSFIPVTMSGSAEAAIARSGSRTPIPDELRRSASAKDMRNVLVPDRSFTSSPVKTSRPGLNRSVSENRGRRTQNRPVLPKLAPAARPVSQASSTSSVENTRPLVRSSGRASPLKSQHRLSGLASIPEAIPQPRTRTSVRFTIDSRGRARAETTILHGERDLDGTISHQRTSRNRSQGLDFSSGDDSSTDDEPIIIPSRTNSFNASFALPDPLRPVGSIFHSSRRSVSDRSTSSFVHDGAGSQHEAESEAETVMNDHYDKVGDATSELRKVIEDRQKRSNQIGNSRSQRFLQTSNLGSFRGDTISPSTLTEASLMTDRQNMRCVCNRKASDEGDGFMVQCESCEMWLHGKCINITRRTLPRRTSPVLASSFSRSISWVCSIDAHGTPLTDETLAAAKAADAVLLGSIGGPKWGTGTVRPEQGLLRIRKEMGTYGNLRPCFFASDSLVDASPLKAEVCRGTDFVIVRELTGGIYFGERKEDDGSGSAWDMEPYTRAEIERVARLAGFLARGRGEKRVWSLDKANVLATSRLWRKNPTGLNGVVVTSNLFGDIISDEASVIPGSIGLLPSASLSGIPDGKSKCNGIYEPIHGSAPDISGQGIVNPIGTILSVAMLLRYSLNLHAEAKAVEDAVRAALDGGLRSKDLGGNATTKEVGDAVVKELARILKA
ncbi:hypothetical protein B0J13DRAFT_580082 [Dactylonectria estremocensis]|uniref:3-isopropylmalate dehydrogenase n=1 Tax=Dactylonectria estremocensis TaxID=1079267 RepID=A0A9P9FIK4_9HYPO|nr:hypothetical protein B0J13DRAFT_580082 [Dactylonectria estremocensis]